jgi:PsbP
MYLIISFLIHVAQPWIIKGVNTQRRKCNSVFFQQEQQRHRTSCNYIVDGYPLRLIHANRVNSEIGTTGGNITSNMAFNDFSVSFRRQTRRDIFQCLMNSITAGTILGSNFEYAVADSAESVEAQTFRREMNQFRYEIHVPSDMNGPIQKPLKTHYDEVNFKSTTVSGYEIGITVDPVRIDSLIDFGTPEEVAAKVVLAEVNRDGVLEVKLLDDPISGTATLNDDTSGTTTTATYYQLNYVSNGKRGRKRYIAKFYVQNHMLLALTAQCKDDTYESIRQDMNEAVSSFRVV